MMDKKMTKDEIIEILKKNVELYRNEPAFIDYLVNLTIYLLEYQKEDSEGKIEVSSFQQIAGFQNFFLKKEYKCHNCGKIYNKAGLCPECGAFNE